MKRIPKLIMYLSSSLCFVCNISAAQDESRPLALSPKFSLALEFDDSFPIGLAVKQEQLQGAHSQLIVQNFNRLTAEYEMKWGQLKQGNSYNFAASDSIIRFAQQHSMKVTGHTLVWHIDNPPGLFTDSNGVTIDRATLRQRLKDHIFTVVGHFKGSVDSWDVVNEALSDDPNSTYRPSSFFQIFGNEDYIIDAFQFAQSADPGAELWYNDYVLESPEKLKKLVVLIQRLKTAGVKLTGIGFQGHYSFNWPSVPLIEQAFQTVINQGLKIKVSELDMTVYEDYPNGVFEPEPAKVCDAVILQKQAERFDELFKMFRRYKQHLAHVTLWGLTDDASWLNQQVKGRDDCPLLFDRQGQPKPAFYAAFR